jgi:predicted PurR-regulated permease PerM
LKNIVVTIVVFAIAIGLIVGVVVPIAQHTRTTAVTADNRHSDINANIGALAQPIN